MKRQTCSLAVSYDEDRSTSVTTITSGHTATSNAACSGRF